MLPLIEEVLLHEVVHLTQIFLTIKPSMLIKAFNSKNESRMVTLFVVEAFRISSNDFFPFAMTLP